jgi:uncharacterized protein YqeY
MEITVKENLTIKDLKKLILTTKKDDKELSKAYGAILKQVESMTVGVKNPETDESKLILTACKKEKKEQEQSKTAGAPFSEMTLSLCSIIFKMMSPKLMSENETEVAVKAILSEMTNPNMGQVMGRMKAQYGELLDMKALSGIVKQSL